MVRTLNRVSEQLKLATGRVRGLQVWGWVMELKQNHSWAPETAGISGPQVAPEAVLLPISLFCPRFPFLRGPCVLVPEMTHHRCCSPVSDVKVCSPKRWSLSFLARPLELQGKNTALGRSHPPGAECSGSQAMATLLSSSSGLALLWNFILKMRHCLHILFNKIGLVHYNVGRCLCRFFSEKKQATESIPCMYVCACLCIFHA